MVSVRPVEFVVDTNAPFEHDRLARQARVEGFCRLIMELRSPAVLAVNGPFGSGKSVFLRMCAAHLRGQELEVAVAEFNAWQQSHTQVPLVDLVAALTSGPTATDKAVKSLRAIAVKLAWRAASAATRGIIEREDFRTPEDVSKFGEWKDTEDRRAEFHKALAEVVDENGKLVVLIDELDRCPPERALEILDVARHLFDVPGVVVVLGINEHELRHRVTKIYGQGCNAEEYLRRFVDLAIDLPGPGPNLVEFLDAAVAEAGLKGRVQAGPSRQFSGLMLELLASRSGMSARDIVQLTHRIARVLALVPAPESSHSPQWALQHAILSMCVLRWASPEAYRQLAAGAIDAFAAAAALIKALSLAERLSEGDSAAGMTVAMLLRVGLGEFSEMHPDEVKKHLATAGIGDAATVERIQSWLDRLNSQYFHAQLDHIIDLVELAV